MSEQDKSGRPVPTGLIPSGTCPNCSESFTCVGQQFVFRSVIICSKCYKLASAMIASFDRDMNMAREVYMEVLRTALIRKQLRPPIRPVDSGSGIESYLQQLKEKLDVATRGTGSESKDTV